MILNLMHDQNFVIAFPTTVTLMTTGDQLPSQHKKLRSVQRTNKNQNITLFTVFPLIVPDPPSSLSSHLRQKAKVPNVLLIWERSFFALGRRSGT